MKVSYHLTSLVYTFLSYLMAEKIAVPAFVLGHLSTGIWIDSACSCALFHDLQALLDNLKAVWFTKFINHQLHHLYIIGHTLF